MSVLSKLTYSLFAYIATTCFCFGGQLSSALLMDNTATNIPLEFGIEKAIEEILSREKLPHSFIKERLNISKYARSVRISSLEALRPDKTYSLAAIIGFACSTMGLDVWVDDNTLFIDVYTNREPKRSERQEYFVSMNLHKLLTDSDMFIQKEFEKGKYDIAYFEGLKKLGADLVSIQHDNAMITCLFCSESRLKFEFMLSDLVKSELTREGGQEN